MNAEGEGGCGVVVICVVLVCYFGCGKLTSWREEGARTGTENEARTFAERHLPTVQPLLDEMDRDLVERSSRLEALAKKMRHLNIAPDSDADYRRWTVERTEIREARGRLCRARNEAFVEWTKIDLAPLQPAEKNAKRQHMLEDALRVAQEVKVRLRTIARSGE